MSKSKGADAAQQSDTASASNEAAQGSHTPPARNPSPPAPVQETTKVRVLRDSPYGLVGEVAEIPTELVAGAEASGMVDSNEAAVAYAESLKASAE